MIRRLRPGDEDIHLDLARRFKEHVPTRAQSAVFLADDRNWLLVATGDNDEAVGFALAYLLERWDGRRHVFFYEIEVEEAVRRGGHGRKLVDELKRLAREAGAYEMWVETEPGDVAANALYRSAGGEHDGSFVSWVWKL